jgi:Bacterial type II/III secretion system short domain
MSGPTATGGTLGLALAAALVLGSGARGKEREARLSLDLKDAPVVEVVRARGLGREEEGDILRIATVSRLKEEAEARRKLDEERRMAPVGRVESFRLSYARAQEMASLLQRTLPPTARVTYDSRTNTLILVY